jgi:hypothetical protein
LFWTMWLFANHRYRLEIVEVLQLVDPAHSNISKAWFTVSDISEFAEAEKRDEEAST